MNIQDRKYPRIPVSLSVLLLGGEQPVELTTTNVSLNGAFLRTDSPRPLRQLVQLRFSLPAGEKVEVMAMVSHILSREENPEQCGMGVGFFALSEEAKNTWNRFLRALERDGVPETMAQEADGTASTDRPEADLPASSTRAYGLRPVGAPPIRRKHARHAACFVVRLKDEARARQFYTENISAGGMFFKTPLVQKEGAEIELVLVHPKTDEEFRLPSTVVRVERSGQISDRGMGVQFLPLSVEQGVALEQFIETGINYLHQEAREVEAIASLRKAVEMDPRSPHAHTALGKALLQVDAPDEALDCFAQAIALSPHYLPALLNLKDLLLQREEVTQAVEVQAQIDAAMGIFARSIAHHSSKDVLDEAPILPPDQTLTNSLIYEVLEHKYAHTLDGSGPALLLPPLFTTHNEQPSVLSLIQQQKGTHSVDLIPAYPPPPLPEHGTLEEIPRIQKHPGSRANGTSPLALGVSNDPSDRDLQAENVLPEGALTNTALPPLIDPKNETIDALDAAYALDVADDDEGEQTLIPTKLPKKRGTAPREAAVSEVCEVSEPPQKAPSAGAAIEALTLVTAPFTPPQDPRSHTLSPASFPTSQEANKTEEARPQESQKPDAKKPAASSASMSQPSLDAETMAHTLTHSFEGLLHQWNLLALDLQLLGTDGLADEAQKECMVSLEQELDMVRRTMKRLHQRTKRTLASL